MAERLMAADCKSAALTCYGGSNPSLPTSPGSRQAHVAQLVEHVLGKDGVSSSNLLVGSTPSEPIALFRGSNSGVESQPSKLLVAGSNPVSRSTLCEKNDGAGDDRKCPRSSGGRARPW